MDPRDFQRLALRLVASGGAADRRTAVSRCYYAVFNVAAEHLRSLRIPIGKGGAAHGEIRLNLINSGVVELLEVGSAIQDLHMHRIRADYQLERLDAESESTASSNVATAARLIVQLDKVFGGSSRGTIHATILKWRRENGYP